MDTLDNLWAENLIMVQTSDYKAIISEKLSNGWYKGQLLSICTLGYTLSSEILVPGNQAIWTVL